MLLLWITAFCFFFLFACKHLTRKEIPPGLKPVPMVDGCLPIVGHCLNFSLATIDEFILKCFQKYGKIFKLKFFNKTWVILCDKDLNQAVFSASEESLSFYEVFRRFYVFEAFNAPEITMSDWMPYLKQCMATTALRGRCSKEDKELAGKMAEEAFRIVDEIKTEVNNSNNSGICLSIIMTRYVCAVCSTVLIGTSISPEIGTSFYNLTQTLNQAIMFAAYLPHFLIRLVLQKTLEAQVSEISGGFKKVIKEYKVDPAKENSLFLRYLTDLRITETERKLTETETGKCLTGLLFISSESTVGTLVSTILNALTRPVIFDHLRKEVGPVVERREWEALFDLPFLHGCVMETARLGTKMALAPRAPVGTINIGDYYVGDADFVCVAGAVHTTEDVAFKPEKYLEKKGQKSLITWGAGTHGCTGRVLSLKLIKVIIAILVIHVNFEPEKTIIGRKLLLSNSAVTEFEHQVFIRKE